MMLIMLVFDIGVCPGADLINANNAAIIRPNSAEIKIQCVLHDLISKISLTTKKCVNNMRVAYTLSYSRIVSPS